MKMTHGVDDNCFDFGAGTGAQEQLVLDRGRYMKMGHSADDTSSCATHDGSSYSCARELHIDYRRKACSEDRRTKHRSRDSSQSNAENVSYPKRSGPRQNTGLLRNHGSSKHTKACTGTLPTLSTGYDNSTGDAYNVAKWPTNVRSTAVRTPTSPTLSSRALSSPSFIQQRAGDTGVDGGSLIRQPRSRRSCANSMRSSACW